VLVRHDHEQCQDRGAHQPVRSAAAGTVVPTRSIPGV
jgi:hypothetical protein